MIGRVTDAAIHAAVASALRAALGDDPDGAHRRTTLVQLVGLTEYAARRGDDASDDGRSQIVGALRAMGGNPLLSGDAAGDPWGVAAAALAQAIGRQDDGARQVQAVLRPLLLAQLDAELATTVPLIDAFRGKLRADSDG